MSVKYRGVVRVAGSALKGWLADSTRPGRRVSFNLIIDGKFCGSHIANRKRRSLVSFASSAEGSYSFSVPIRKSWITGGVQNIRLETPGDVSLSLALTAKLGPAAGENFEEHVVSGQAAIGDRARELPGAPDEDDETSPDGHHRGPARGLLKQIVSLSNADLVSLMVAIQRDVVHGRLERYEKADDWQNAEMFRRFYLGGALEHSLSALGRSAVKVQNFSLAGRLTAAAAALRPQSFEANFGAGLARAQQGDSAHALTYFQAAEECEEKTVRAKRQIVLVLERAMRGELAPEIRSQYRAEHISRLRQLYSSREPGIRLRYRLPLASALQENGNSDEAMQIVDGVLATAPNDPDALLIRARILVARNEIADAYLLYQRVQELVPDHQGARLNIRLLASLLNDQKHGGHPRTATGQIAPRRPFGGEVSDDWIGTSSNETSGDVTDLRAGLALAATRRAGCTVLKTSDGRVLEFWHLQAVAGLVESGLVPSLDETASLAAWRPFYLARKGSVAGGVSGARGIALIVSGDGKAAGLFDHRLLQEVAEHHRRQGLTPVLLKIRMGSTIRDGYRLEPGSSAEFAVQGATQLRRVVLENSVALVHAISGAGLVAAEALDLLNVPFIFGISGWNELIDERGADNAWMTVGGREGAFSVLLSRADAIYAASRFAQRVVEEEFGVRCPVMYGSGASH